MPSNHEQSKFECHSQYAQFCLKVVRNGNTSASDITVDKPVRYGHLHSLRSHTRKCKHKLKVIILGTASAPVPRRSGRDGTGILVSGPSGSFLFDCGPGVTKRLVSLGIDLGTISSLFITHHHYDHISDLPLFVMCRWEWGMFNLSTSHPLPRKLRVYGPKGTRRISDLLFGDDGVYAGDIRSRIRGAGRRFYRALGIESLPSPKPTVREIAYGDTIDMGQSFKITAARTQHVQPYLESLAYRIESDRRIIVISGDAAPSKELIDLSRGADLLVHECTKLDIKRSGMHMQNIHSSPTTVAKTATDANVKKLVLLHFGPEAEDPNVLDEFRKVVKMNYDGEFFLAKDLDQVEI